MVEICPLCQQVVEDKQKIKMNDSLIFCRKSCLDKFLQSYSDYYNKLELSIRKRLNLEQETSLELLSQIDICKQVLENPLFALTMLDCRKHQFFLQYGQVAFKGANHYLLIIYTVINAENFFLFVGASKQLSFVKTMVFNLQDEHSNEKPESPTSPSKELLELLDFKKSQLLPELMESLVEDDFSFSEYMAYAEDGKIVIEQPDELFLWSDGDGDQIFTYSKVMQREKITYYYVVIALYLDDGVYPILMFPTKFKTLLVEFQRGVRKLGQSAN